MAITVRFVGGSEKSFRDADEVCLQGALVVLSRSDRLRRRAEHVCSFPSDQVVSADVLKDGVVIGRVVGTGSAHVHDVGGASASLPAISGSVQVGGASTATGHPQPAPADIPLAP